MSADKYDLEARIFPAIICTIPIVTFYNVTIHDKLPKLFEYGWVSRVFGNVSIEVILIYFFIQMSRFISKFLFQKKYFNDGLNFPTVNFLLYKDNEFTFGYKEKIRKKIRNDFNIKLSNKKQELENELTARKKLLEAVGLIISKVKDGKLVLPYNITYGFFRNLFGGLIITTPISLIIFLYYFFFQSFLMSWLFLSLITICLLLLVFRKEILFLTSNNYAKKLFSEYLVLNDPKI